MPLSASGKSSSPRRTRGNRCNPLSRKHLRPNGARPKAALALAGLLALLGCSTPGPRPAPEPLPGAATASAVADWDDVQASVTAALAKTELVLVRREAPQPDTLVFMLRTSRDEPAVLTVRRLDPENAPDPVRLTLACSVSRFGDAARERQFLGLVTERLSQLRGVEVAPIAD